MRLGIDVGDVRIGLAQCDPDGIVATPVETVARGPGDLARIAEVCAELGAIEVLVGLPRSLSGREGPAADKARAFALEVRNVLVESGIPAAVRLIDERLTTVSAERQLRESGRRGAKQRAVVDQAAAVVIVQHAIDSERATGRPPGQEVS